MQFSIISHEKEMREVYKHKVTIKIYVNKTESEYNNKYYAEYHQVQNEKELSGSPLKANHIKEVYNVLNNYAEKANAVKWSGLIPKNVLYCGRKSLTWYREIEKRRLYFVKKENVPTEEYLLPKIVFHLNDSSLSCFAVIDDFITINSVLNIGPFPNVATNGVVCMGNMEVEFKETYEKTMEDIEDKFYNSFFTHENTGVTKSSLYGIYRKMAKDKSAFPVNELIPVMKLKKLIDGIK